MQSKKYTLNKGDLKSLFIGFLIMLAGATLTFIAENVNLIDFGNYTPFVVVIVGLLVNLGRKYISGK